MRLTAWFLPICFFWPGLFFGPICSLAQSSRPARAERPENLLEQLSCQSFPVKNRLKFLENVKGSRRRPVEPSEMWLMSTGSGG